MKRWAGSLTRLQLPPHITSCESQMKWSRPRPDQSTWKSSVWRRKTSCNTSPRSSLSLTGPVRPSSGNQQQQQHWAGISHFSSLKLQSNTNLLCVNLAASGIWNECDTCWPGGINQHFSTSRSLLKKWVVKLFWLGRSFSASLKTKGF